MTKEGLTIVRVEKGFFIKSKKDAVLMSWDGVTYQPVKELIRGTISAAASAQSEERRADGAILSFELNQESY